MAATVTAAGLPALAAAVAGNKSAGPCYMGFSTSALAHDGSGNITDTGLTSECYRVPLFAPVAVGGAVLYTGLATQVGLTAAAPGTTLNTILAAALFSGSAGGSALWLGDISTTETVAFEVTATINLSAV